MPKVSAAAPAARSPAVARDRGRRTARPSVRSASPTRTVTTAATAAAPSGEAVRVEKSDTAKAAKAVRVLVSLQNRTPMKLPVARKVRHAPPAHRGENAAQEVVDIMS